MLTKTKQLILQNITIGMHIVLVFRIANIFLKTLFQISARLAVSCGGGSRQILGCIFLLYAYIDAKVL